MGAFLWLRLPDIFRGLGRASLRDWKFSLARFTRPGRIALCHSNQMRCSLASPPRVEYFERTPAGKKRSLAAQIKNPRRENQ